MRLSPLKARLYFCSINERRKHSLSEMTWLLRSVLGSHQYSDDDTCARLSLGCHLYLHLCMCPLIRETKVTGDYKWRSMFFNVLVFDFCLRSHSEMNEVAVISPLLLLPLLLMGMMFFIAEQIRRHRGSSYRKECTWQIKSSSLSRSLTLFHFWQIRTVCVKYYSPKITFVLMSFLNRRNSLSAYAIDEINASLTWQVRFVDRHSCRSNCYHRFFFFLSLSFVVGFWLWSRKTSRIRRSKLINVELDANERRVSMSRRLLRLFSRLRYLAHCLVSAWDDNSDQRSCLSKLINKPINSNLNRRRRWRK